MMNDILDTLGITKGPWRVKQLDDCFIEPNIAEIPANGCYPYDKLKGNSQLIAAAPEMLEVLIMLKIFCDKEWSSVFRNITRDVIEKVCYPKKWNEIKAGE